MSATLDEHFGYLNDRVRLDRYQSAISQIVQPEHVVLDLGCGSGILGLLSLSAGARKVLFVEELSTIQMAQRAVELAGFADRAEFFKGRSYDLELPEKVDVILCDHIGYFGFDYDVVRLLSDAKNRFLRSGGVIVPGAIDFYLAPVSAEEPRELVQRWKTGNAPEEFAWVARSAADTKYAVDIVKDDLLAIPVSLGTLNLGDESAEFFTWSAEFAATKDADLDGLAGWFDCALHGNVRMTNSPIVDDPINRPLAFLPLADPVPVAREQRIKTTVMARPLDYVLAWTIELPDTGQKFEHSTFNSLFYDSQLRESLARSAQ